MHCEIEQAFFIGNRRVQQACQHVAKLCGSSVWVHAQVGVVELELDAATVLELESVAVECELEAGVFEGAHRASIVARRRRVYLHRMSQSAWAVAVSVVVGLCACAAEDSSALQKTESDAGADAARVGASSSSGGTAANGSTSSGGSGTTQPDGSVPSADDAYAQVVLADAPVAYWRFGESTGTLAKDEIGNAHPGTFWGGFELGVPGITAANSAARFDGSGCVGVGEFFRFPGRVAYSAEGWVKISEYGAEGTRIISTEGYPTGIRSGWNLSASYGDTGYPYFDAWSSEGTDNQYVMGAYSKVSPEQGKLLLDEWNHVVGTFDDEAESVWVNGVLRDRVKQSALARPNQGTFTIGCAGNGSGPVYLGVHGAVDEIAVYDKVLSDAQIAAHYAAGKSPVAP